MALTKEKTQKDKNSKPTLTKRVRKDIQGNSWESKDNNNTPKAKNSVSINSLKDSKNRPMKLQYLYVDKSSMYSNPVPVEDREIDR